jgi:hypothetical protein
MNNNCFLSEDQTFSLTFDSTPKTRRMTCLPREPRLYQTQQGIWISVAKAQEEAFKQTIAGRDTKETGNQTSGETNEPMNIKSEDKGEIGNQRYRRNTDTHLQSKAKEETRKETQHR